MNPFQMAWLNLTRRRIPTLIALAAIALSVAGSGVLLRLYLLSGARFSTLARGGDAMVGAKAGGLDILLGSLNLEGRFPDFLPYQLYETLRAEPQIQFPDAAATPGSFIRQIVPMLHYARYGDFRVIGTDQGFIRRVEPDEAPTLEAGREFSGRGETVIGSVVADSSHLKPGDRITVESVPGQARTELVITGVLAPTHSAWDRGVYTAIQDGQLLLSQVDLGAQSLWRSNVVNYLMVYLKPGGRAPLEALINRRSIGQVISVSEERARFEELTGTGRRIGFLMSSLIMLLGGLSVAAMMITRFDAMTVQLAVLRALGYGKSEVSGWLLWEGMLLGAAACLIGAITDAVVFPWVRASLGSALPGAEVISSSIFQSAPVWISAIVATTLAVLIPLYRLYRQDVHLSLKG